MNEESGENTNLRSSALERAMASGADAEVIKALQARQSDIKIESTSSTKDNNQGKKESLFPFLMPEDMPLDVQLEKQKELKSLADKVFITTTETTTTPEGNLETHVTIALNPNQATRETALRDFDNWYEDVYHDPLPKHEEEKLQEETNETVLLIQAAALELQQAQQVLASLADQNDNLLGYIKATAQDIQKVFKQLTSRAGEIALEDVEAIKDFAIKALTTAKQILAPVTSPA